MYVKNTFHKFDYNNIFMNWTLIKKYLIKKYILKMEIRGLFCNNHDL